MVPFWNLPLEIVEEVINALREDIVALKACSQACSLLLPLGRKHLFHSIELNRRGWSPPTLPRPPRTIEVFGRLLDRNPEISTYVRNLKYDIEIPDYEDGKVPLILGRLHQVQSLQLGGVATKWELLHPLFRDALIKIIQSRSISSLDIRSFTDFPISILIPCTHLVKLAVWHLFGVGVERYESKSDGIIRFQSFSFYIRGGPFAKSLLGCPVFDFSNVRDLSVVVERHSDLAVVHALIEAAERLERLTYTVEDLTDGFAGLAKHMNRNSLSTLRRLCLDCEVNDDIQDPLCGLCDELMAISGFNVIEKISLKVTVQTDCPCKTGDEWGRLDAVLAQGFPKLHHVSLHIIVAIFFSTWSEGTMLQQKLNRLQEEQFPLLFGNGLVIFEFSTELELV